MSEPRHRQALRRETADNPGFCASEPASQYGRRLHSARQRAQARFPDEPRGDARRHFRSLDSVLFWSEEEPEFHLHLRVSERPQRRNLDAQAISCLTELTARGVVVSGITREISSGWRGPERVALKHACELARQRRAVLLFETVCRGIRSVHFHTKKRPDALPSEPEFQWLSDEADGLQMSVIVLPATDWKKVRGYQVRRSRFTKRLRKADVCRIVMPHVRNLMGLGWRRRHIARAIGVSESTLRGWH